MKPFFIKNRTIILPFIIVSMLILGVSCTKKVNQWNVDPSHDRLFRPLDFGYVSGTNNLATSVEIKYTKIISANKYIFEFYKGKFQFDSIVKQVEILADTLTPFAFSTTPNRIQYRTIFTGLDGNTGYTVRMKGVDTINGVESAYSQFYFETGKEQLFNDWTSYTDSIRVRWKPTKKITFIGVYDTIGTFIQKIELTPKEIDSASAIIENLEPGSFYKLIIFNGNTIRGSLIVKTTGIKGGYILKINPDDDIADLVMNAINDGKYNISLLFNGSDTYDLSDFEFPSGVENLGFVGIPAPNGRLPLIKNLKEVKPDQNFGSLIFEQVKMVGDNDYLIYFDDDNVTAKNVSFFNCELSNYRAIVRAKDKNITINNILFNNCLIDGNGGYGVVNIGGSTVRVDTLSFKNSTLIDLETQLMDVRTAISYIYIGHCTFCNLSSAMSQLLRFDDNHLPLTVVTEANIIAGNNSGAKINSLSFDASSTSLNVSFGGSYITSDLVIDEYGFSNITVFNGSTYDLFVDPDNKNFAIKPESGFGGRGTAGDPRWFE